MEKKLETAKKLLELAKRGIDGERENAKEMLDKFLIKNNLTIEEIEDCFIRKNFVISINVSFLPLVTNVIESILQRDIKCYKLKHSMGKGKKTMRLEIAEITELEFLEVLQGVEAYQKDYLRQLDKLRQQIKYLPLAFCTTNKLFFHSEEEEEEKPKRRKRKFDEWLLLEMSLRMSKTTIHKALNTTPKQK